MSHHEGTASVATSRELANLHSRVARYVPGALVPHPKSSSAIRHLIRRTTWGATPDLLAEVSKDPEAWLRTQLEPEAIDDRVCDSYVVQFPDINRTISDVRASGFASAGDTTAQMRMVTLARYMCSRRQLFEVMVDFWANHLNVSAASTEVWFCRHDYDSSVIRRHALGRFKDMLIASCKHPAMLTYLDSGTSSKKRPNENYAREVMELHTVGVGAGYGEAGVRAAARVFTGLAVGRSGDYVYSAVRHDTSAATVLDWTTPAHEQEDGEEIAESLLGYLAHHPATAAHIARKLAIRFVADDPSEDLVGRLADVYLANDTNILPVLKTLLASDEFWLSQGGKTRRPMEAYIAVLRALGAIPGPKGRGGLDQIDERLKVLGHSVQSWKPPDGYPDVAASWRSAGGTMNRWNATIDILRGIYPKQVSFSHLPSAQIGSRSSTYGELVDDLISRYLGRDATSIERNAILTFMGGAATDDLGSGHRWQEEDMVELVCLILNSPGHMER